MSILECEHPRELPATCDLKSLGLDPAGVTNVTMIHQKHGNRLYRIEHAKRSFVLKWFRDSNQTAEIQSYALLEKLGVPTLPVYGRTEDTLLLEDLVSSSTWRLAEECDIEHPATGAAVADWYLALHSAGREVLEDPTRTPEFLEREVDSLDAETVTGIGKQLGLDHDLVWTLAAEHIEAIKDAMRSLPETLNYTIFIGRIWRFLAEAGHCFGR